MIQPLIKIGVVMINIFFLPSHADATPPKGETIMPVIHKMLLLFQVSLIFMKMSLGEIHLIGWTGELGGLHVEVRMSTVNLSNLSSHFLLELNHDHRGMYILMSSPFAMMVGGQKSLQ